MKAADAQFNLVKTYLGLLDSLSDENKLELISKLSDSLKKSSKEPEERRLKDLYGAFSSQQSADELIATIKANRTFRRNTEEL